MTRPPYDPRHQEPGDLDPITRELERYTRLTSGEMPRGLTDRVMAGLADEPVPPRGLIAWLLAPFAARATGGARLVMVATTMALAVLAVVVAGQLSELFGDPQIGPSPSPPPVQTASPTPSATPSATPSRSPSPSPTPTASPSPSAPSSVPSPTGTDDDEIETPEPSDDDNSGPGGGDDDAETPEPSDDDNSGPGGGDDGD